jgi:hypothetical protein
MARPADVPKDEVEQMKRLLYHPHGPCANPGRGVMMNKPEAVGVIMTAISRLHDLG